MSNDVETLMTARRGRLRAVPARDYREDDNPTYNAQYSVRRGAIADGRSVLLTRARLVRDGIRSVSEVCSVTELTAIAIISREMHVGAARIARWAERGVHNAAIWAAWQKVVDALTTPVCAKTSTTLPTVLSHWRNRVGLSLNAASRRCGVASGTYSAWERGESIPQPHNLERLRKMLGPIPDDDAEDEDDSL